jgi:hypothetical protein
MKPHDETWRAEGTVLWDGDRVIADGPWSDDEARLAAQAPAMARLWLEFQWSGRDGAQAVCPICCAYAPDPEPTMFPTGEHSDSCALARVLREAGVLP